MSDLIEKQKRMTVRGNLAHLFDNSDQVLQSLLDNPHLKEFFQDLEKPFDELTVKQVSILAVYLDWKESKVLKRYWEGLTHYKPATTKPLDQ